MLTFQSAARMGPTTPYWTAATQSVCYYFGPEDPLIWLWADNIKQELIQMVLLSK